MTDFTLYFTEGVRHITDWMGYDHILFITALCLPYDLRDWKKLLWLVTAFTLGHTLTLALSVYNQILVPSAWVEFLIPVTIAATAITNVVTDRNQQKPLGGFYLTTLFFGLIHGMGFSNYLRSMLGKDESIFSQLFAFNIGLEAGQLLIVAVVLVFSNIFAEYVFRNRHFWLLFASGGIFGIALIMALERIPFH
jgi:HupE / UreJ protein